MVLKNRRVSVGSADTGEKAKDKEGYGADDTPAQRHTHTHTHEKGGREPGRESRRKRWRGRKREGMMGECV